MFSIVIPLYNKEKQLRQTLETVLGQTFQDFEVVIVDDGSTDGSVAVLDQFSDKRIRLFRQPNQGVSAARNRGIKEAQYDYIALLDADDEWYPDYLSTQVDLIQSYPECSVYACGYEMKNYLGETKPLILNKIPFEGNRGILTNYFEVASCSSPPLWTSAVVLKKEAIQAVGGFPLGINHGEDLLTWAKLSANYSVAYSLVPLSIYNIAANKGQDDIPINIPLSDDIGEGLVSILKTIKKKDKKALKKYIGYWYKIRANLFLRGDETKQFIIYFFKSLKYNALNYKLWGYGFFLLIPFRYRNNFLKYLVIKFKKNG